MGNTTMVRLAVALSGFSAARARIIPPSSFGERAGGSASSSLAYQNYIGPRPPPRRRRNKFEITAPFPPSADQPAAIRSIVDRFEGGERFSILRGCTGTGKTMVMAHAIAHLGRPTLVLCHNKTLAAQLARELRSFLRNNHVHLFVSPFDHYVPESYSEASGRYVAKRSSANDELDALRHMATRALAQHRDVVVVASVSCTHGLGMPREYLDASLTWKSGGCDGDGSPPTEFTSPEGAARALEANLYENAADENTDRHTGDLSRGQYELSCGGADGGSASIALWPPYELFPLRIDLKKVSDHHWNVSRIALGTNAGLAPAPEVVIFPARHHITASEDARREALRRIQEECDNRCRVLRRDGMDVEADRLQRRVANDLVLLRESGICPGVENYSRHLGLREGGVAPETLLDYFGLRDDDGGWMLMIDERHVALPQLRAMHAGDRARKLRLVEHGYRLPSALDNRPLRDDEFWDRAPGRTLFVSATPGPMEMRLAGGRCVDMTIRPTYVPDPAVEVRPTRGQLDDLAREVKERAERDERTLALALTKRDAEDLSAHLKRHGIAADYVHSGLKTRERSRALKALQAGDVDCLVGVNVLREGLDLPQVSLVAVLGADVEGFLRSETALLQMVGRAARNINGKAILHANHVTKSMRACIEATGRRRSQQLQYNKLHGKEMRSTIGSSMLSIFEILKDQIHAEQALDREVADDPRGVPNVGLDGEVLPTVSIARSARGGLQTDHIPSKPGVYFWKDGAGSILYIGKAKRLRSRVKSYLAPGARHGPRIRTMLKKAQSVEFILTPSERDALLLEASMIGRESPPYNVLLKEGESYPFICASVGDPLPSFSVVPRPLRTPKSRDYRYFGPYPNLREINEVLAGIEGEYDLRSKSFRARFGNMTTVEYQAEFRRALEEVFLSPDTSRPLPALRSAYEGGSLLFQHEHNRERDIISIAKFANGVDALVHIVQMRDGMISGQFSYSAHIETGIGCDQDMGSLIQTVLEMKHYNHGGFSQTKHRRFPFFPKELLVQYKLPDPKNLRALFRQHISESSSTLLPLDTSMDGKKVRAKLTIRAPAKRGRRKETDERAMTFALDNAEEAVRQRVMAQTEDAALTSLDGTAARELADLLSLGPTELNRIEAYDISHTQGDVAVGSRVVFEHGRPVKEDYRRFNIRSADGSDDYASLEEVLNRRFRRAWINGEGGLVGGDNPWKLPDLVVIDGGKGQLSAALKGMARAGVYASNGGDLGEGAPVGIRNTAVPAVSLAKNLEEVFVPGVSEPINESPNSAALLLLRSLRDESHRFALANHRRRRSKLMGLK